MLAPVQALVLKHLLFPAPTTGASPAAAAHRNPSQPLAVPAPAAQRALLAALEEALWGCGGEEAEGEHGGGATVAWLLPAAAAADDDALLPPPGSPPPLLAEPELLIDSAAALRTLVRARPPSLL